MKKGHQALHLYSYAMMEIKINMLTLYFLEKGETTEQLAMKLFAKLPRKTIEDLYQHYSIDFQMFNYDYRPYYDIGIH